MIRNKDAESHGRLMQKENGVQPSGCQGAKRTRTSHWTSRFQIAAIAALALGAVSTAAVARSNDDFNDFFGRSSSAGAVFVGTNHNNTSDPSQPTNQVAVYQRAANGTLRLGGYFNTGGQGSGPGQRFAGDGLGAAHSVELSKDRRWLFVTNAGSNNVSVFHVSSNDFRRASQSLKLTDVEPTGDGTPSHRFPNSVTQRGNLVYVLNSADEGSITGFRLSNQGTLTAIPNSTRLLDANQDRFAPDALKNPTQVSFTPDGRHLVITIKDGPAPGALPGAEDQPTGPGRVLVFGVGQNGVPSENYTQTNLDNHGPFGFSFDRKGNLLIALFVGGPNLTGAVGSFHINADGSLTPITPDVPNTQVDGCWLENNGRYAFGANYTSGTISSYRIGTNGSLTLLQAVAGTTDDPGNEQGPTPLDLGISPNGRFLYNVLPGSGKVAGWQINNNGSLTKLGEFGGLPQTVDGDHGPFDFSALGSPAGIAVF